MDGAAGDADAVLDGLALRVEAGEGREQRGVYVEDAPAELFRKAGREQPHVAREADQLDAAPSQLFDDLALVLLARAAAALDDRRLYPARPRGFEPAGPRLVAYHETDARVGHATFGDRVGQRRHVRPAPRDENPDVHKGVDSRQ